MVAYYSEFDRGAAAWLRELIRAGLIPDGDVDERSIAEVRPADLAGYTAVHLFAGIGGWPYALRLAGWPDERPVWTGSCPCQPFSSAGKGGGTSDPRHLWPEMRRLVGECRPPVCFGEQVASAAGRGWFAGVRADLEAMGYAVGAADLCAAGAGAPAIRQRLFWVADAEVNRTPDDRGAGQSHAERNGSVGRLADSRCVRCGSRPGHGRGMEAGERNESRLEPEHRCGSCWLADANGRQPGDGHLQPGREHGQQPEDGRAGVAQGDTSGPGSQERRGDGGVQRGAGRADAGQAAELPGDAGRVGNATGTGDGSVSVGGSPEPREGERRERSVGGSSSPVGFWSAFDLIPCRDGKSRRVEPGTFPLAHGVPGRVGLLRGYGNAIVPQIAAEFVRAWQEATR